MCVVYWSNSLLEERCCVRLHVGGLVEIFVFEVSIVVYYVVR